MNEDPTTTADESSALDAGGVHDAPVLAFVAPWAAAWRVLERQIGDDMVHVRVVDIEKEPGLADRHNVAVVPTFIARMPDRREVRRTGAVSAKAVRELLQRVHCI